MQRRDFMKLCAAAAAAGAQSARAAERLKPRFYSRVELVDEYRKPLKASSLVEAKNYIFHYPFEGTPCFLLNLGRPTVRDVTLRTENGGTYVWPGGVGPGNAIVGYSAICAHRMTYPTRQISFISYRRQSNAGSVMHSNVIHCCSEHSQYDPAAGARVVDGPAPQPLSAILLEHDPRNDALHAVGTLGGEMFHDYFDKFAFKLALDYGSGHVRTPASGTSVVTELAHFCKQQVRC